MECFKPAKINRWKESEKGSRLNGLDAIRADWTARRPSTSCRGRGGRVGVSAHSQAAMGSP